jgi:hypothetical protein
MHWLGVRLFLGVAALAVVAVKAYLFSVAVAGADVVATFALAFPFPFERLNFGPWPSLPPPFDQQSPIAWLGLLQFEQVSEGFPFWVESVCA